MKLCICIVCTAFLFYCSPKQVAVSALSADPRIAAVEKHRSNTHQVFMSEKSPLTLKDRKKFKGLLYYPIDLAYNVPAKFVKTESPQLFKMKTTTTRMPDYRKYGDVFFNLLGREYHLEVYQSIDLMKNKEYEDHLFIPFTDETNGKETYEVGRYLEMKIPESDSVVLDFNLCYNPYCAYGGAYSCPIPPEANHLPLEVKAGEMKYHNSH